jgi:hypothetical protein
MANLNMDYNMGIKLSLQTNIYNFINNMYINSDFDTDGDRYKVFSCFFHVRGGREIIRKY